MFCNQYVSNTADGQVVYRNLICNGSVNRLLSELLILIRFEMTLSFPGQPASHFGNLLHLPHM